MSLDIAILDEQGVPTNSVAVTPESHTQLMQQAGALSLHQFSRMYDYYQDVDYTVQETSLLQQETETLVTHCAGRPDFCNLVDSIQELVRQATNDKKAVVAIAD